MGRDDSGDDVLIVDQHPLAINLPSLVKIRLINVSVDLSPVVVHDDDDILIVMPIGPQIILSLRQLHREDFAIVLHHIIVRAIDKEHGGRIALTFGIDELHADLLITRDMLKDDVLLNHDTILLLRSFAPTP